MSVRSATLISTVLVGLCLGAPTLATGSHPAKKASHSATPAKTTLVWRGDVASGTIVFDELARAWERAGHGKIELQPFNTASGIDAVASGQADLGGSARAGSASPEDQNLTFTPVAWDALVIVTQSGNPVSNLTLQQVHDIYYGKIGNWAEVGGKSAPIDVYAVASPKDGIEYSLRSLLFGRGTQPVAAPRLYVNTHMLEKGIEINTNGLGVDTLADIRGKPKLKALSIDGIVPSAQSIADGSYPLFTTLYLVTNPQSSRTAETQAFIDFVNSPPGAAALRRGAVLPYADGAALATLDAARRERILAAIGKRAPVTAPAGATSAPSIATTATTATSIAGASSTAGPAPVAVAATYTVGKGDTLSTIAKKHAVQPEQLREWNHLKSDRLQLGQSLRISIN
ncbi:MAG: substrate-binding domain-containing protein [Xanthomonadales bacterium]|nr:substrate-binding domain-containing protein [Xanthomonadales bacterium]